MIKINNVTKLFNINAKDKLKAVDDVSVDIEQGEIFGVIGYSGAGKSTLIRMLNGLEGPTNGTVTIGDQVISAIRGSKLRKARHEIGMIFQHFNLLWSRTVRGNISFPLEIAGVPREERKKRVNELIELVGLEGRGDAYPSQLSGGQKQRVGIARALANNPKVLLCDEATSALDPQTTDSILELLVDINRKLKLTIVLITHEMHVIQKICHRVAVMEKGRIVEMGEVLEVFKNPQQSITKRFVQQLTDLEDTAEAIQQLLERYQTGHVVKLTFVGDDAEKPVVNELIRSFDCPINIIQGKISQTQKGSYGTLFLHINDNEEKLLQVISFLNLRSVGVEVLKNV